MVKAIVGSCWGDEGKGKATDMLAERADVVVRFQGGANAGHTIINHYGKFALHLLPSGVFHGHITNVIGNGVALDIAKLKKEYEGVVERGVPAPKLLVSQRAQILMPYHILFDCYEEERLGARQFGSTKSGIAPFYSDKYAKTGIQVCELFNEGTLRERLRNICEIKNLMLEHIYHKPPLDADALADGLLGFRDWLAPFAGDADAFLRQSVKEGREILLEGQLGSLRDPDLGIYPMTTSSSTLAGYGAVGAGGIPPWAIQEIVAVVKAYSSAVGAGAFTSEIFGEEAEQLRRHGGDAGEYGATTGRPRRVGWFDCVAARYGCAVQGATQVALSALDCLSYLDEIQVCVGYEIDGEVTREFPVAPLLGKAKPILKSFPGFGMDIRGIREYAALPQAAKDYVDFLETELEVPITMVSNGPERAETLRRSTAVAVNRRP
ncbi:MAG: adenylosuccinate synthase [Oscillospiraceae bacterium]|jgi:adenylosuccinate synthase|nr:adenylosuccinate synthase [Oscillospiraceae bacterium]